MGAPSPGVIRGTATATAMLLVMASGAPGDCTAQTPIPIEKGILLEDESTPNISTEELRQVLALMDDG